MNIPPFFRGLDITWMARLSFLQYQALLSCVIFSNALAKVFLYYPTAREICTEKALSSGPVRCTVGTHS